ncbi:MAG: hypothetical protein LBB51_01265, partial [Zoogloeaceae bacterium]|nr:hypothetical protein [Zoogloeaceae bacterium]
MGKQTFEKTQDLLEFHREVMRNQSDWSRKTDRLLMVSIAVSFVVFMLPEAVSLNIFDFVFPFIYWLPVPAIVVDVVKASAFPASASLLFLMTPFVAIYNFCVVMAKLWPSEEFDKFMIRREKVRDIGMSFLWMAVSFIIGPALILWAVLDGHSDGHNPVYNTTQPLRYKLSFFLVWYSISGLFPMGMAGIFFEL